MALAVSNSNSVLIKSLQSRNPGLRRGFFLENLQVTHSKPVKVQVSSTRRPMQGFFIGSMLCGLLAVACMLPGLNGPFIFDDAENIVKNTSVHLASLNLEDALYAAYSFQPGNGSRALSMLSFALDYWRGGMDPSVFKSTNLAIHALTTVVLAILLRHLLLTAGYLPRRAAIASLVLAALWAVHPLQVSTVLYVVQRMQTLVTLFMLLSLWAYLRMRQAQIHGQRSRLYGALTGLFWVLGYACKEDAILLPAYTLALELTVLRFRAASRLQAKILNHGYLLATLLALAVYLLVIVPHYWHWQAYPARNFSSYERLLTQGRVLMMYISQILLPLPKFLPFYYDDLTISRGWLQPITTVFSWLSVFLMLAWAWLWRTRRPLFSLGILIFFAGHFLTSNIINLELAFEHRNHFPMIGILLAASDLCMAVWQRLKPATWLSHTLIIALVLATTLTTTRRAHAWGDEDRLASSILAVAPHSERAWIMKAGVYVDRSKFKPGADLDKAISITHQGIQSVDDPTLLLSNALIYKSIAGSVSPKDWEHFLQRLRKAPMSAQNRRIMWTFIHNRQRSIPLDEKGVIQTLEIISARSPQTPSQYLELAAYLHNETTAPGKALLYLRKAVETSPADDPDIEKMLQQLAMLGKDKWAKELHTVRDAKATERIRN